VRPFSATEGELVLDAVLNMAAQNAVFHRPQRGACRAKLGQDIDAVAALIDHFHNPVNLPASAVEATELIAVVGVVFHVHTPYPLGVLVATRENIKFYYLNDIQLVT